MNDPSGLQLANDVLGPGAWNGQADSLESAGATPDGRVDADDLPFQIDQRATAVAGVDGRVGLKEVFVHVHVQPVSTFGANDTGRYSSGQSEGRADRQDSIANF